MLGQGWEARDGGFVLPMKTAMIKTRGENIVEQMWAMSFSFMSTVTFPPFVEKNQNMKLVCKTQQEIILQQGFKTLKLTLEL